jgi:hypothetical protein
MSLNPDNMLNEYYTQNGWVKKIAISELNDVENFLKTIPNLNYVGHGGTCIAFSNNKDTIIKVCLKCGNGILKDKITFLNYCDLLIKNNVKILYPLDILYEDINFIIYNNVYSLHYINNMILIKILQFVKFIDQK